MTAIATWVAPPIWSVPREWAGERCFVICSGPSLGKEDNPKAQLHLVPRLQGRVIVVKENVRLRPAADVVFFAGEYPQQIAPPVLQAFRGTHAVVRGKGHRVFPDYVKRIGRTPDHSHWSADPTMVAGLDSGTSAINLAILFGATEIILLGYDMTGNRWFAGEPHPVPVIPDWRHEQHLVPLLGLAADAKAKGIRIVNCSPTSRATSFEYQPLEAFL